MLHTSCGLCSTFVLKVLSAHFTILTLSYLLRALSLFRWWCVNASGTEGYAPANYIALTPKPEPAAPLPAVLNLPDTLPFLYSSPLFLLS